MQSYTKFEEQIKEEFSKKTAGIYPSEDMFCNIKNQISEERERGIVMNTVKIKRSRGILVACIILILTTATCFAAVRIASYTSSGNANDFESYPSKSEMKKTVGFLPDYIETFSNGFTYRNAGGGEVTSRDEKGDAIETVKQVTITYEKDSKNIFLGVENGNSSGEDFIVAEEMINITKDIKGAYTEDMYKFLPPDYEMTEQDKADEANGTYIFSYGSQEIEIQHVQSISWNKDGMSYNLMSMDDGVTKDELIAMAVEVIESK